MAKKFLALAQTGKNQWWRYFLGILIILVSWQVIGAIPFIILVVLLQNNQSPETKLNSQTLQFEGVDTLLQYLVLNFSFVCFLIGLYITVCFIHHRNFITLITPQNKVNRYRVIQGIGAWIFIVALFSVIDCYFISVGNYKLTFNFGKFLIFLPIALILTPVQASVEELFFRGYLMQGIGLKTRKPTISILVTSLLFMLFHLLNPEVKSGFLLLAAYYFLLAVFLAVITIKNNGLELAIGVHIGNNLFNVLFANYSNSALPAHSIFTIQKFDPISNLISVLVFFVLFYLFVFRRNRETISD
jgi:membrane protease YdiL (CAAX protease family)